MFDEDVPPGDVASGENAVADSVKSTAADAAGSTSRLASTHKAGRPARLVQKLHLDSNNSDFSMSGFRFKYLRFLGHRKGCPHRQTSSCLPTRKLQPLRVPSMRESKPHFTARGSAEDLCNPVPGNQHHGIIHTTIPDDDFLAFEWDS